ncbi:Undecaprenyl phosphate-alpha-4-amino-4-deoxy-L-arabinose arabinosyl transferase [Rosistilla carotiformis]|uniref:Undecaprenyl phosphate-alpha-4-amino-4-deoxy-L-arabinose arabinosyl transferase n=1 Tax=Rosistilla carotiformis TaxID=2528017 RepID=A0A518K092_9BACT|nr:glycosyltransferase [Rosistilla carotiformis]QDV71135.1 Undecaprenyl phosphate-alpha-4-amino-4-deoxy-L-arabinose arabinosyl transferase [Rosistilla carotiformis]
MHSLSTSQASAVRCPSEASGSEDSFVPVAASLSLVLPAWNEAEVIESAIKEADHALAGLTDCYEIIVVDDGSSDNTAGLVAQAAAENPKVRLIRHQTNQGYGASLRSGFQAAQHDLVVFTDADCQFDLTELDRFVLLSRRYDIVCGYRIDRKDTALRCLYSRGYNQLVRLLLRTQVRDIDCALKMFHRDHLKDLQITTDGFLVNSELLTQAKQRNLSVVEVGVSHRPRTQGQSTVSVAHIPRVATSLIRYWWNAVQFSGTVETDGIESNRGWKRSTTFWMSGGLVLIAAIFMLTNLGYPLIDRDETRYAEIPREMLATGDWIVPQLNFQTYYDKPPLVYWLCALSYKLLGIHEYAARLIPALAGLATLVATLFFGIRMIGPRGGLLAGVVLMLSFGFAFTSRYLLIDGVLSLWVTLALFTAYEAVRDGHLKWKWWLLSALFCGLGLLTKGPVAAVLWLPPLVVFAWLTDSAAMPRWRHFAVAALVSLAVVVPWGLAVAMQDPEFLPEFLYKHNLRRFAGDFHARPIWFFVPVLLLAGHPWSFLTIPYCKFLLGDAPQCRRQRPTVIGFLLLWSCWCFLFFSLSRCKLPTYLLPAAPAFALLIGHYLSHVLGASRGQLLHQFAGTWSPRMATLATTVAGVGIVVYAIASGIDTSHAAYLWGVLWLLLSVVAVVVLVRRQQRPQVAWASSAIVALGFAVMMMHVMVPAYSRDRMLFVPDSPLTSQLNADPGQAIATVAHEFSEVPFYLRRSDISNFNDHQIDRVGMFVAKHHDAILIVDERVPIDQIRDQLPRDLAVTKIADRGLAQLWEVAPVKLR